MGSAWWFFYGLPLAMRPFKTLILASATRMEKQSVGRCMHTSLSSARSERRHKRGSATYLETCNPPAPGRSRTPPDPLPARLGLSRYVNRTFPFVNFVRLPHADNDTIHALTDVLLCPLLAMTRRSQNLRTRFTVRADIPPQKIICLASRVLTCTALSLVFGISTTSKRSQCIMEHHDASVFIFGHCSGR